MIPTGPWRREGDALTNARKEPDGERRLVRIYCSTVVSPANIAKVRELGLGVLCCATSSNFLPTKKLKGIPIACDNGAWMAHVKGYWFNELRFLRLLDAVQRAGLKPEWIVAPDIVCGGLQSLKFSVWWAKHRLPGAPLALAVQNGMEPADVLPFVRLFRCIFVGGDLPWKWATAGEWSRFAHEHGLLCHIGRAGEVEDMHRAEILGADSVDSTTINRGNTKEETEAGVGAWHRVDQYRNGEPHPDFLEADQGAPK